ncbi:hypothetical protein D9611_006638 [Ephemerocybe angulata]|uniref:SET domain-containing protein n=1 Tax=Ephemerocybe angulata TaxID=980116 RepID=A0A8H5FHB1_9AGAR|nr:hypothetical protein D9611_006638 [Tulosesus angulatus]
MSDFKTLKSGRKQRSFVPQTAQTVSADSPTVADAIMEAPTEPQRTEDTAASQAKTLETVSYEGLFSVIPQSLEIKESTETGRSLYSTTIFKPGDILFSVKPHVAALSISHLDRYCSSCFGEGDSSSLKRCTGCKTVMYCSPVSPAFIGYYHDHRFEIAGPLFGVFSEHVYQFSERTDPGQGDSLNLWSKPNLLWSMIECQQRDWSLHKNECTALQQWFKAASAERSDGQEVRPPSDAIRCLGRILWKRQKLGASHTWSKEFDNMQSHRSSLSKDAGSFNSEVHTHLAHGVVGYLGLTSPEQLEPYGIHSAADLVDLVSRFTTNTFTVTTPTLSPLGACVAPSVALINHSCDPNAVIVFPRAESKDVEPLLQVIALKHIQPGEEILTSYIDTTLPRELRQQSLKETYHFTCRCPVCAPVPGAPVDMREAMWCPKKCGGLCVLPTEQDSFTRCAKCGAVVKDTDAVLDALRIGQEALEKAERVQDSDPKKALQLTENLGQILISAGLVPGAHPLLALTRLQTSLLISKLSSAADPDVDMEVEEVFSPQVQQDVGAGQTPASVAAEAQKEKQNALDDAIRAATRAKTGLSQVLVYGHPVRGVAAAELGKLLAVDEPAPPQPNLDVNDNLNAPMPPPNSPAYPPRGPKRLKLALEVLVEAWKELVVGDAIVGVEKELGVWREG